MRALCCPFAITRRERRHLLLVGAQANDCETLSRLQHEASRTRGRDPKFEAPWGLLPDRLLGLLGALEGTSSKEELLRSQLFVPSGTTGRALRCCTLSYHETITGLPRDQLEVPSSERCVPGATETSLRARPEAASADAGRTAGTHYAKLLAASPWAGLGASGAKRYETVRRGAQAS